MESLLSVSSAVCCDDACYDSTNNLNNKSKQRLLPSNRFVPEIEEIRINPIKFIVIRRPLLFIYNNEKDPVERMLINLSKAKIIYNEDQIGISQVVFFFCYNYSFI